MLPNFRVIVLVIHFVRGISQTPRARSSNPGVEVVARCIWEEKRYSIWASNFLISSDIMLLIMSSTFIAPGGTGPSGGGGSLGVEHRIGVVCLLTLDHGTVCLCCARLSFTAGVSSDVNRGCIGVIGL